METLLIIKAIIGTITAVVLLIIAIRKLYKEWN